VSTPEAAPYNKPLPDPTPATQPFWDGLREHKLVLQRSKKTGKAIYYPRSVSPNGPKDTLDWVECTGRGTVYSFTIARRPTAPQWTGDGDYAIAIVEIDEGARLTANIVNCPPEAVRIGMRVKAVFLDVTPEVTLLQFEPE
jgi:uncharacterized OB-fold protein